MRQKLPSPIQKKRNGDDDDKHQYHQKIISLEFSPTREAKVKARAIPRYRGRKSYAFHRRLHTPTTGHRSAGYAKATRFDAFAEYETMKA